MNQYTAFVTNFIKSHGTPEMLLLWKSSTTRKEQCKKRCCCYILFCIDKRQHFKTLYPHYKPSQITALLAQEWRKHKELRDEVYEFYKSEDRKQVFKLKNKVNLINKYPKLSTEDIDIIIAKMYEKYCLKEKCI